MDLGHPTEHSRGYWLTLLCRLLVVVAFIGGVLAVAILGSSFPIVVLAALLLACLAVCLVLLCQGRETEGSIERSVVEERRCGGGSSPGREPG